MSLEVKDFKTRKIKYELECGDFYLKPLYMAQQVEAGKKMKKVFDFISEKLGKDEKKKGKKDTKDMAQEVVKLDDILSQLTDEKTTIELLDLELDFLRFALEGETEKLTKENFQQAIFNEVVGDFFQQLQR